MAKKLGTPYTLSEDAQRALNDENIQNAAKAPNVSQAMAAMVTPTTVNTVEDATKVSNSLGRVNKSLRAARVRRSQ